MIAIAKALKEIPCIGEKKVGNIYGYVSSCEKNFCYCSIFLLNDLECTAKKKKITRALQLESFGTNKIWKSSSTC